MTRPASRHRIIASTIEVLGQQVLSANELAERLRAEGVDLGPDGVDHLAEVLESSSELCELEQGWIAVGAQLDGTAWCTVLDEADAAEGRLWAEPDLRPLSWWAMDVDLDLGDEQGVIVAGEGDDHLIGPPGWLEGLAGPVVVRVDGRRLSVARLADVPRPTDRQAAAMRAGYELVARDEALGSSLLPDDEPQVLRWASAEEVVWQALLHDPDAFRNEIVPPLDVVLGAAGLECHDDDVAEAGFDWLALSRWRRRRRHESMYRLEPDEVDLAELLIGASLAVIDDVDDPLGPADEEPSSAVLMAYALQTGAAAALWGHHRERQTPPEDLVRFAERLLAHLSGPLRAGPAWLAGRAADLAGDPVAAEAWFTDAVECGAEHPPALVGLGAFHADRGDAVAALRLLRRVVDDEDELLDDELTAELYVEVAPYAQHRPQPLARRNDPCPCGSGRKYKACHLGQERHPLVDRGPWLYRKARRYLRNNRFRQLTAELGETMARAAGRGPGFMFDLLDSELLADVVLCEGGVLNDFVTERQALLPDDEALTATQWQLVERSVFEVERARHDSLELRDLRSGEHLTVTNTNPSDATRPGGLLLGRPLPVDETWRAYSGFVPIGGPLVDEALAILDDPGPFAVAELIGRCLAGPRLSNTDGEPLVGHELTWRVSHPHAVVPALVEGGWSVDEPDADGVVALRLVRDTMNQPDTAVLMGRLDGDELVLEANSDRRADEALGLVARQLPDAELVDHDVRSLDEMMAEHRPGEGAGARRDLDEHPELAELVEQHLREMEQRWIDESIPALGGRTPREAAADPIGRVELERLFASMPRIPGGRGMDPDRMRALLGM